MRLYNVEKYFVKMLLTKCEVRKKTPTTSWEGTRTRRLCNLHDDEWLRLATLHFQKCNIKLFVILLVMLSVFYYIHTYIVHSSYYNMVTHTHY